MLLCFAFFAVFEASNFHRCPTLYDRVGVLSNADKTSEYETPVENEHQRPGNETVAGLDREFYDDVDTNANESEDISAEGQ